MLPGFTDALVALMPTLEDHACSLGRRGGFITRLRDGTWAGHIAEHVALELQNLAGTDVRHGKTRSAGRSASTTASTSTARRRSGSRPAGWPSRSSTTSSPPTTRRSSSTSRPSSSGSSGSPSGRRSGRPRRRSSTRRSAATSRSSGSTATRSSSSGHGVHQQRIRATMTSQTSAIGVDVASDKSLTNRLLDSAGLPVPRAEVVDTEDDAVAAAKRLGFPCVVKPLDGNHGRGVHLDLRSEEAVRAAFHGALAQSRVGRRRRRDVRRRQRLPLPRHRRQGRGHRRARAGLVTGDGEHTVRAARRHRQRRPATRHRPREGPDPDQGGRGGRGRSSAPRASGSTTSCPTGTRVKLALTGNMSTGGTSIDRTIEAHPDNVEIAETAARIVGLDVAGIDFICPDIATPVRETGGAIVEVNAAPGFRMHTHPTEGEPQYVARPVIDSLFPAGASARIPIIAVTGTNGKTTTVRMIAHILKLMGRRVGMTSTDGIVVDGRLIKKGDMSGPKSAQMVLQNPTVDTAVFEVARGGILREGLGYDRNDVAVVTNVTGDHLGLGGITRSASWPTSRGSSSRPCRARAPPCSMPTTHHVYRMGRHCAGRVVLFSMSTEKGEDGFDRVDGHTSRGNAAFCLEPSAGGRARSCSASARARCRCCTPT